MKELRDVYYNDKLNEILTFKKTGVGAISCMSSRLFGKISHNVLAKKGPKHYGFIKIGKGKF